MRQLFQGLGVSPGVAIGRAFLLHPEALPVVPAPVPPERVDSEIDRFEAARGEAQAELRQLKNRIQAVLGDSYAGILEAQLLILDDPSLVTETIQRIRVGRVSARWALKEVVADLSRRFHAVDDAYIRERGGDLSDVHHRLQRLLRGERRRHRQVGPGELVVVAHNLVPSDAVSLAAMGVVGLAADVGGRTSHTAILAQALSVPAVAGLHDFSLKVRSGDPIILDGRSGRVLLNPDDSDSEEARESRRSWIAMEREAMAAAADAPVVTRDGVEILLRANIEFPSEIESALSYGARGIGLYRSEFLFLSHSPELPSEEEHFRTYLELAERVAPHPAVIRTLDLGGEKYFHEVLDHEGANPVLGMRGVRLCLKRQDIFRPQLRGLLRASARGNVQVMLPLVSSTEEIWQVRKLLASEADELAAKGVPFRSDMPLGIMVEVPGAAIAADILAREVDFFSIGTNDLIQYALAVDRDNESVNYLYRPMHPGVLRMVRFVVDAAGRQGIPVSLCGEMAADEEAVGVLIGLGLRELSVQPRAIPTVRKVVRGLNAGEALRVAEEVLDRATASEVERRLRSATLSEPSE